MEVSFDDVARAHERIKGAAHRTPVLRSAAIFSAIFCRSSLLAS